MSDIGIFPIPIVEVYPELLHMSLDERIAFVGHYGLGPLFDNRTREEALLALIPAMPGTLEMAYAIDLLGWYWRLRRSGAPEHVWQIVEGIKTRNRQMYGEEAPDFAGCVKATPKTAKDAFFQFALMIKMAAWREGIAISARLLFDEDERDECLRLALANLEDDGGFRA